MKITSRGLVLALVLGISPAAVFVAQAARDGGWGMSTESRQRLQEGKLAAAKATLKLSPDQEKLWAPIEEQVRANFKERADKRAERQKRREERRAEREARRSQQDAAPGDKAGDPKAKREKRNIAERYERMAARMGERADKMKSFAAAFSPFYASLSDEQKAVIGPVMRDLRVAHWGGRRGHRHHGWHDGGWRERWGGKHRGHDRGGPSEDESTPDNAPGAPDAPDADPQKL